MDLFRLGGGELKIALGAKCDPPFRFESGIVTGSFRQYRPAAARFGVARIRLFSSTWGLPVVELVG